MCFFNKSLFKEYLKPRKELLIFLDNGTVTAILNTFLTAKYFTCYKKQTEDNKSAWK